VTPTFSRHLLCSPASKPLLLWASHLCEGCRAHKSGKAQSCAEAAAATECAARRPEDEALRSATNIFFSKGFHATSIEDVARDVGMLKGSLYYYIKSKDDLLFQLLMAGIEDGDAYIAQQIDVTRDPVEQLERAVRAQINYIIQNKVPFGLFLHEFDSLSGKRQHKLISVMSRYNSRFVDLVRRGQEQGKLMEGEPWIIVNGILGMCNWLYRWYDTDHVSDPEEVKQIFVKMILDGIRRH